jgi:4a-hydroxytetrahydrobiopterin dehydratase
MKWTEANDGLEKDYEFEDFKEAFAFISKVALLAEKHQHHPEIQNVYNRVYLRLSTHDAGNKITDKDHQLATAIDALER